MNNMQRIVVEIQKQAEQSSGSFDADTLLSLCLEIVNREDEHTTRQTNINQIVQDLIDQAANLGDPA